MMFDSVIDLFRGKAVTIPPLDGALKPNTALDDADVVQRAARPDNVVKRGNTLLYSSGKELRDIASNTIVMSRVILDHLPSRFPLAKSKLAAKKSLASIAQQPYALMAVICSSAMAQQIMHPSIGCVI
jgi:hypothetical protein